MKENEKHDHQNCQIVIFIIHIMKLYA